MRLRLQTVACFVLAVGFIDASFGQQSFTASAPGSPAGVDRSGSDFTYPDLWLSATGPFYGVPYGQIKQSGTEVWSDTNILPFKNAPYGAGGASVPLGNPDPNVSGDTVDVFVDGSHVDGSGNTYTLDCRMDLELTPLASPTTYNQSVTVTYRYAGDCDLDGDVDFADFLTLSNNFGTGSGWSQGDFDHDGDVDFRDFNRLSNNFGL